MKNSIHCLALICALFLSFAISAFGFMSPRFEFAVPADSQPARLAPNVPFEYGVLSQAGIGNRLRLSDRIERVLEDKFAHDHVVSAPLFDFSIGGMPTSLQLRSEVLRIPIDSNRRLYYKSSRLIYKYEPKYWPTGFIDLAVRGFLQPATSLFQRDFNF
jgi:hypothetical protein